MILRDPAQALDVRTRWVWAVEGALATAVLGLLIGFAVVVLVAAGAGTAAWVVGAVGAAAVLASGLWLAWLVPGLQHRHFRYEVTELGLYVARGWLWRRWHVVPHARIETVDVTSGPLLRVFGLVAVQVATAAAGGGTGIPGLARDTADQLVDELARRAGVEGA